MTRESLGQALSLRIHSAESALDQALAEIAALAAALPEARMQASIASTTAQSAFDGLAASLSCVTEARSHLGDAHRTLAALARRLGLETVAMGPMDKPEDGPPLGGQGIHAVIVNGR